MVSKWILHIKDYAQRNNLSYGCALSKPECSAEYREKYPKLLTKKQQKAEAEEEARLKAEAEAKAQMKKKGRKPKYTTEEEKYKAKLESNKLKRREKRALAIGGMINEEDDGYNSPPPPPSQLDRVRQNEITRKRYLTNFEEVLDIITSNPTEELFVSFADLVKENINRYREQLRAHFDILPRADRNRQLYETYVDRYFNFAVEYVRHINRGNYYHHVNKQLPKK